MLAIVLQHLTALTQLIDLRLVLPSQCSITATMLSGAQHLTRLQLTISQIPRGRSC